MANEAIKKVLANVAQNLTNIEKQQARDNIGAAAAADVVTDAVRYSEQHPTIGEQAQARANIDAAKNALASSSDNGLMSNTDKVKLDGIQSGAEANVQSDWNQTNHLADDFIKNKPENLVQDANYVHTDNNFTTILKNKLDSILPNKLHRLAFVGDNIIGETSPYGYWVIDLEQPDANAPGGYKRITGTYLRECLDRYEMFCIYQYNDWNFKTVGWMSRADDTSDYDPDTHERISPLKTRIDFVRQAYSDDPRSLEHMALYTPAETNYYAVLLGYTDRQPWWDVTLLETTGNGSNVYAQFEQASTFQNLVSGDTLAIIFGKIMKWISGLSDGTALSNLLIGYGNAQLAAGTTDLNANITVSTLFGSGITASGGIITLNPGRYSVNALVEFDNNTIANNNGLTAEFYKLYLRSGTVYGSIFEAEELFDNSWSHNVVKEISFCVEQNSSNPVPLSLYTNALNELAGLKVTLKRIEIHSI